MGAPGNTSLVSDKLLGIYLNDHLAGATAGIELARRILEHHRGTDLEADLEALVAEIEQDRRVLERLMEDLAVTRSPLKRGTAWIGEKVTRLKMNGAVFDRSPLSRLIELEAMSLGIEGKRALWQTLRSSERLGQEVAGVDLDDLIARAEAQRALVDRFRLDAASTVFMEGD